MLRWTHWRFPYFCTYCLIQCFVHSWTQCCFPCFIHIVFCSVTYTVGHTGVFPVLYILFDAMLHVPVDTLTFSVFLYTLFDACFVHRSTNWCFPYFCTYCLMHCYMHRWTHSYFPCFCTHCLMRVSCTVRQTGVFPIFVHTV